ncbi:proteophosphoglycan related, partial [Cystoisospora suis]
SPPGKGAGLLGGPLGWAKASRAKATAGSKVPLAGKVPLSGKGLQAVKAAGTESASVGEEGKDGERESVETKEDGGESEAKAGQPVGGKVLPGLKGPPGKKLPVGGKPPSPGKGAGLPKGPPGGKVSLGGKVAVGGKALPEVAVEGAKKAIVGEEAKAKKGEAKAAEETKEALGERAGRARGPMGTKALSGSKGPPGKGSPGAGKTPPLGKEAGLPAGPVGVRLAPGAKVLVSGVIAPGGTGTSETTRVAAGKQRGLAEGVTKSEGEEGGERDMETAAKNGVGESKVRVGEEKKKGEGKRGEETGGEPGAKTREPERGKRLPGLEDSPGKKLPAGVKELPPGKGVGLPKGPHEGKTVSGAATPTGGKTGLGAKVLLFGKAPPGDTRLPATRAVSKDSARAGEEKKRAEEVKYGAERTEAQAKGAEPAQEGDVGPKASAGKDVNEEARVSLQKTEEGSGQCDAKAGEPVGGKELPEAKGSSGRTMPRGGKALQPGKGGGLLKGTPGEMIVQATLVEQPNDSRSTLPEPSDQVLVPAVKAASLSAGPVPAAEANEVGEEDLLLAPGKRKQLLIRSPAVLHSHSQGVPVDKLTIPVEAAKSSGITRDSVAFQGGSTPADATDPVRAGVEQTAYTRTSPVPAREIQEPDAAPGDRLPFLSSVSCQLAPQVPTVASVNLLESNRSVGLEEKQDQPFRPTCGLGIIEDFSRKANSLLISPPKSELRLPVETGTFLTKKEHPQLPPASRGQAPQAGLTSCPASGRPLRSPQTAHAESHATLVPGTRSWVTPGTVSSPFPSQGTGISPKPLYGEPGDTLPSPTAAPSGYVVKEVGGVARAGTPTPEVLLEERDFLSSAIVRESPASGEDVISGRDSGGQECWHLLAQECLRTSQAPDASRTVRSVAGESRTALSFADSKGGKGRLEPPGLPGYRALTSAVLAEVDPLSLSSGKCIFSLGPRAVLSSSGVAGSPISISLPDAQRRIVDAEAQLRLVREYQGMRGVYDSPEGLFWWGDSGLRTGGINSTSVTKLPAVLFGAAVTAWNEMLVYREPQLILLLGDDARAADTVVPNLLQNLLVLGNVSLGLQTEAIQYLNDSYRLVRLLSSVRRIHQGCFSDEAEVSNVAAVRWDVRFTKQGDFCDARLNAWLIATPGMSAVYDDPCKSDIVLRLCAGIVGNEDRFLGTPFEAGVLRPVFGKDEKALSLGDEEKAALLRECFYLFAGVLRLAEAEVLEVVKLLLVIGALVSNDACVAEDSIACIAKLLGVSPTDLHRQFGVGGAAGLVEPSAVGRGLARHLYQEVFRFAVERINSVSQAIFAAARRSRAGSRAPGCLSVSILENPSGLAELTTPTIGGLACHAAQSLASTFAFRRVHSLRKLLHCENMVLPPYLSELSNFAPEDIASEALLRVDRGLFPFLAAAPREPDEIASWLEERAALCTENSELPFFSETLSLVYGSHAQVAAPRAVLQISISDLAAASRPQGPTELTVADALLYQGGAGRLLRASRLSESPWRLLKSECFGFCATLVDVWKQFLSTTPIVVGLEETCSSTAVPDQLTAVKQWEEYGFPLFVSNRELPLYCPNLFPPESATNMDDLVHYMCSYVSREDVLYGSHVIALRSQAYERLQQLQLSAAAVVARRRARLSELLEDDEELCEAVREHFAEQLRVRQGDQRTGHQWVVSPASQRQTGGPEMYHPSTPAGVAETTSVDTHVALNGEDFVVESSDEDTGRFRGLWGSCYTVQPDDGTYAGQPYFGDPDMHADGQQGPQFLLVSPPDAAGTSAVATRHWQAGFSGESDTPPTSLEDEHEAAGAEEAPSAEICEEARSMTLPQRRLRSSPKSPQEVGHLDAGAAQLHPTGVCCVSHKLPGQSRPTRPESPLFAIQERPCASSSICLSTPAPIGTVGPPQSPRRPRPSVAVEGFPGSSPRGPGQRARPQVEPKQPSGSRSLQQGRKSPATDEVSEVGFSGREAETPSLLDRLSVGVTCGSRPPVNESTGDMSLVTSGESKLTRAGVSEDTSLLSQERDRLTEENSRLHLENARLSAENLRLENVKLQEENVCLGRALACLADQLASARGPIPARLAPAKAESRHVNGPPTAVSAGAPESPRSIAEDTPPYFSTPGRTIPANAPSGKTYCPGMGLKSAAETKGISSKASTSKAGGDSSGSPARSDVPLAKQVDVQLSAALPPKATWMGLKSTAKTKGISVKASSIAQADGDRGERLAMSNLPARQVDLELSVARPSKAAGTGSMSTAKTKDIFPKASTSKTGGDPTGPPGKSNLLTKQVDFRASAALPPKAKPSFPKQKAPAPSPVSTVPVRQLPPTESSPGSTRALPKGALVSSALLADGAHGRTVDAATMREDPGPLTPSSVPAKPPLLRKIPSPFVMQLPKKVSVFTPTKKATVCSPESFPREQSSVAQCLQAEASDMLASRGATDVFSEHQDKPGVSSSVSTAPPISLATPEELRDSNQDDVGQTVSDVPGMSAKYETDENAFSEAPLQAVAQTAASPRHPSRFVRQHRLLYPAAGDTRSGTGDGSRTLSGTGVSDSHVLSKFENRVGQRTVRTGQRTTLQQIRTMTAGPEKASCGHGGAVVNSRGVEEERDVDKLAQGMRAMWIQAAFSGVWRGVVYWPKHLEHLTEQSQRRLTETHTDLNSPKCSGEQIEVTASNFFDSFAKVVSPDAEKARQLVVSSAPPSGLGGNTGTVRLVNRTAVDREAVRAQSHETAFPDYSRPSFTEAPVISVSGRETLKHPGTLCVSPGMRGRSGQDTPGSPSGLGSNLPESLLTQLFSSRCSSPKQDGHVATWMLTDLEGTWNGKVVWKPPSDEYGTASSTSTIILVDLTAPEGGLLEPEGPLKVFRTGEGGTPHPLVVRQQGQSIADKIRSILNSTDSTGTRIGAGNVYFIPPHQAGVLAITSCTRPQETGLCIEEPSDRFSTTAHYSERRRKERRDEALRWLEERDRACRFRPRVNAGAPAQAKALTVPTERPHQRPPGEPASHQFALPDGTNWASNDVSPAVPQDAGPAESKAADW